MLYNAAAAAASRGGGAGSMATAREAPGGRPRAGAYALRRSVRLVLLTEPVSLHCDGQPCLALLTEPVSMHCDIYCYDYTILVCIFRHHPTLLQSLEPPVGPQMYRKTHVRMKNIVPALVKSPGSTTPLIQYITNR